MESGALEQNGERQLLKQLILRGLVEYDKAGDDVCLKWKLVQ